MKMKLFFLLILFIVCNSCGNMNKSQIFQPQFTPGPKILVYKTKKDYGNFVPVLLSADKTEIISYPHPNDLKVGNGFPFPTALNNHYLLDNRGINENVAFLKLTYEEYSELKSIPTLQELFDNILDNDPLTELCDCGNKSALSDPVKQLNLIISNDKLREICKTIK
jgi:hypothetical protein